MQMINIGGYVGGELYRMNTQGFIQHVLDRWIAKGNPRPPIDKEPEKRTPAEVDLMVQFGEFWLDEGLRCEAAKWHNSLVGLVNAEEEAREAADQALRLVEERWAELETAQAWHAAHHRYVLAVSAARKALDVLEDRARERDKAAATGMPGRRQRELYEEAVPEADRIPPSLLDRVKTARIELDERVEERRQIVAETLGHAGA